MPLEKILFVDDEEDVLNGFRRSLYQEYEVHLAPGGEAGLRTLQEKGPFAVVVSDMRMPGMNGAAFLSKVRKVQPLATRILLTGYSDAEAAAEAINEGQISRFLTKPCSRDGLKAALQEGVDKARGLKAEKALLENTLVGSIQTLSEVLSAVHPLSFERSTRMSACIKHLIEKNILEQPWQIEAAALLSQLGCMVHPPELVRAAHRGTELSAEEASRYATHPQVASNLVAHIPRMEGVAWLIRNQEGACGEAAPESFDAAQAAELALGAEMLRMAIAYDTLWLQGKGHTEIVLNLRSSVKSYPRCLLDALESMKPFEKVMVPRVCPVPQLVEGMIVDEDLTNPNGALLVGTGQPISKALLLKLKEYAAAGKIAQSIRVMA